MFYDQTPMQRVLDRWKEGNFDAMEREFAQVWRDRLASIDLQKIAQLNKSVRNKQVQTPTDVRRLVDDLLFRPIETLQTCRTGSVLSRRQSP
jgi:hypothetical protein